MSAVTDRLSEDDVRWLARMERVLRARRAAARLEAERQEAEARKVAEDGDHDAA